MTKTLRFNSDVAKVVGANAAVIYQNIKFWCDKNKVDERYFFDEKYWCFNSRRAFADLFEYMSDKQIRTGLNKLESAGFIAKGNHNSAAYDRTSWYCILLDADVSQKGQSTGLKRQIVVPKRASQCAQKGQPIPDIKPNIKPDIIIVEDRSQSASDQPSEILEQALGAKNARDLIDHRNKLRKPLTSRAARGLVSELLKAPDIDRAIDVMMLQGWVGFRFEWFQNYENSGNSKTQPASRSSGGVVDYLMGKIIEG